ncbi:DNA-directed RNA polymerase II subunit [Sorochytrium milnesiophthora]
MFFLKELEHSVSLHPASFTPDLRQQLTRRLFQDVEGSCSGRFGYIISVVDVIEVGKGHVMSGMGSAQFHIKYRAIVFKPFRGEVVDVLVTTVNKVKIPNWLAISSDYRADTLGLEIGFFADVGPVNVFVSTNLMPDHYTFEPNGNPPCYMDTQYEQKIEKGSRVRLKIVGTRIDATQIYAIGSIKEDYLGVIS